MAISLLLLANQRLILKLPTYLLACVYVGMCVCICTMRGNLVNYFGHLIPLSCLSSVKYPDASRRVMGPGGTRDSMMFGSCEFSLRLSVDQSRCVVAVVDMYL